MALKRKTYQHNPTCRLNDETELVDLSIGGVSFGLDPEQAVFIGEALKDAGGRAKARFFAAGYKPEPEHVPADIDALEAEDGVLDGSWAIPKEDI